MDNKLLLPISSLKNWDKNPRAIKKDKFEILKKRIKKYGQFKPVLATADGEVLGGNMRLRAMRELGVSEVWVSVVNPANEAEKIEIALSDNEEMGFYEEDKLAELVYDFKDEIKLEDFSIHLGAETDLAELLNRFAPEEIVEDTPADLEDDYFSIKGAVYQLGPHRLMCGDATDLNHVETLMDGKQAYMVFTDPPYNIDYEGKTKKKLKIQNDKFEGDGFYEFLRSAFTNMNAVQIPGGAIYICHADMERIAFQTAMMDSGYLAKQNIIWVKNTIVMGRQDYHWRHEPILYGWKETGGAHVWHSDRKQDTVWEVNRPTRSEAHPTMKPLELCARAIRNSSMEGDIVLDLFGGSGSTLMASHSIKRVCYTMELDERYCDVIRKRYATALGKAETWQEETPRVL